MQSPDEIEAEWRASTIRRLERSTGVPVGELADLDTADLHRFAVLAGRSANWARGEYVLVAELPPAPPRYRPVSMVLATASMLGLLTITAIICSGIWRFLS